MRLPWFFAERYLGLKLYGCQAAWTRNFACPRLFHAAPRDHGKSLVYSFLLPLHALYRDPLIRILLVSKTRDLTCRFVSAIKREIESNELLSSDFGARRPNRPPPARWTNEQIYCVRPKRLREPTVKAVPFLGSCTGLRADLIVVDDPIDASMCLTRRRRDRAREWFYSELTPVLEPDGRLIVVGTRKHHDDLYASLIANPHYEHRVERAILDEEARTVLCPEKWTYERLMRDREEIGSYLFNREKQNRIVDDSRTLFPLAWLEGCLDESRVLGSDAPGMVFYQGIDPAIVADRARAEERDTDYTVILTLGVLPDGTRVLVDVFRERGLSPHRVMDEVFAQAQRYRPALITIENNLFQRIYELELVRVSDLPLRGHTTTRAKADLYNGVPSLSVLFENRKFRLPAGDARSRHVSGLLIQELHGLGFEAHDDLVMALWMANLNVPPQRCGGDLPHRAQVFSWPKRRG